MIRNGLVLTLGILLSAAVACHAQEESSPRAEPHFNARSQRTQYVGPAEQDVPPAQLAEIRIGYFGSSDPDDPVTGPMWRGAQQAVDEANRAGGYCGKPFRLLPAWSKDPWGTGIKQLAHLVYEERVWAIVGGTDGPSTHLAEQVVAKARLALISPVSTDKTVNLANVPWMFSLAPGDHLVAQCLAPRIAASVGDGRFVLIAATHHDSYLLTRELRKGLDQLNLVPAYQFELDPRADRVEDIVRECVAARPQVVVVVADADISGQVIRRLRQHGFQGRVFGGPSLGQERFLNEIGQDAGDIEFPLLAEGGEDRADLFQTAALGSSTRLNRAYVGRPLSPGVDYTALLAHDAVCLTIEAIRKAGLNRVEIGRALRDLSPWCGVSGCVEWDGLGSNTRRPRPGTIRDGRPTPVPGLPGD